MVHVIKVYLDDGKNEKQIRRLAVGSDVVGCFQLLKERIRMLFQLPTISFDVKWKDSENDEILMSSDEELAQALANADDGLLKLFVNLGQFTPNVEQKEAKAAEEPKVNDVFHPHVICDSCNGIVRGDRYKCLQCKDFDLCSSCHNANKHPHHDMIKLVKPSFISREWVFLGARKMWRSMFGYSPRGGFYQFSSPNQSGNSSSEENQAKSSRCNMGNAYRKFMNGEFVSAEKLLSEGFSSFIQNWPGDVDVKLLTDACKQPSKESEKSFKNQKDEENVPTPSASGRATEQSEKIEVQPKCQETTEHEKLVPTQVCGLFDNSEKTSVEVKETECVKVENEVKSSDTGEREKSPVSDDNSTCAEGWTLLQNEEPEKQEVTSLESEKMPLYPNIEKVETKAESPNPQGSSIQQEGNVIHTNDPTIINALIKMQAMGFTNENGWLERLLVTKKGNINEALDALYPFTRQ